MWFKSLQLFFPIISLLLNITIQVMGFRYMPRIRLLKSIFLGFIIGFVALSILNFFAFSIKSISAIESFFIFIVDVITYLCLSYCYFNFIGLGETGRRIRLLSELYYSKEGLSLEEILSRYNAQEIVKKRIERFVNNGQVIYRDGRYYIGNPLVLFISKIIIVTKIILFGKRSEFDSI